MRAVSTFARAFRPTRWDTGLVCVGASALLVAVFTLQYSQAEDMGIFLSEAALISRGARAYRDISEIKDPLFLWMAASAFRVFGKSGPYILDGFFVWLGSIWTYLLCRTRRLAMVSSVAVSVAFSVTLAGSYFQSFRSGTIALSLIPLLLFQTQKRQVFLAGLTAVALVGLKMAYVPLLAAPVLSIAFIGFRALWRFGLGVVLGTASLAISMALRGELMDYLRMVKLNFEYRSIYPRVVGFPEGISGHLHVVNAYGSSWQVLTAIFLVSILIVLRLRDSVSLGTTLPTVLLQAGTLVILMSSAMWIHHLQVLCIFLLGTSLIAVETLERSARSTTMAIVIALLLPITIQSTGFDVPLRPRTKAGAITQPEWNVPPEVKMIPEELWDIRMSFARLGPNDDMGLAAFLPQSWILACRDYGQYGHETPKMLSEMLDCFNSKPDLLFISPGFRALTRPYGIYEELKQQLLDIVSKSFDCKPVTDRDGAEFCLRES